LDTDLGMLFVRLALGPMLLAHGWNKVFGAGGLEGTVRWFEALGLRPARWHARLAAVTEIGAGVLMAAGLATGPAATAFVGLMVVATLTDHRGKGFFVFKGGWEYTVVVALVAAGVAAIGPGAYSLDEALGWRLSGGLWAGIAVGGGVLAALALLAACYRPVRDAKADA